MIRAIIMDFNGVIINDEHIQKKIYQDIFREEGFELTDADYYACTGMDEETFIKHHFNRVEMEMTGDKLPEIRQKKAEAWRKAIDKELPLCEGVENFILKCSQRFAMGISSMANREDIEYVLQKWNLRHHFTKIVAAGEVDEHKPSPKVFIECFRYLDERRIAEGHYPLLRGECLVIEDVPQGIQGAKAAGMKALGVTNTFAAEILREAGADSVTKTLADWMPDSVVRIFTKTA